jgi:hypothetical protein
VEKAYDVKGLQKRADHDHGFAERFSTAESDVDFSLFLAACPGSDVFLY